MADIIFFAVIAAFLIYRLRSALGRRDYSDNVKENNVSRLGETWADRLKKPAVKIAIPEKTANQEKTVAKTAEKTEEPEIADPVIAAAVAEFKKIDRNFSVLYFMNGARSAFDMIFTAFSKGDKETLSHLLSSKVYDEFLSEMEARIEPGKKHETTLVAVISGDIAKAWVQDKTGFITMKFMSEQVDVTRDDKGEIIAGNPSQIVLVKDVWTFSRDLTANDPNWKLVDIFASE